MADFTVPSAPSYSTGVEWYSAGRNEYDSRSFAYSAPSYSAHRSFEDEPPLLEELGIDVGGILRKIRAILFFRLSSRYLDDLDMGGALLSVFIVGGLHLLMGKLNFGVLLGWSVVQALVLYFVVNRLAGSEAVGTSFELYSCCCLVGYCMLPIAVLSAAVLLIPRGTAQPVLAVIATLWSAITASKILTKKQSGLEESRALVLYPCLLLYSSFALLTVQ